MAGWALALCACSTAPPTAESFPVSAPDPRARSHFSIVWSDPAGLDLLSREGTYVRASVESLDLAAGNGDRDAAYPGFWSTLDPAAAQYAQSYLDVGPDDDLFGVKRFEVVDVAREGDRAAVGVCSYERQIGVTEYDPQTLRPDGRLRYDRQGSYYWRLTVLRTGDAAPPAGQRGPDTFLHNPVFGTWRTVEWVRPAEENPCRGRPTPGVAPGAWPALMPGSTPYITDDDAPAVPSHPGWSNNGM